MKNEIYIGLMGCTLNNVNMGCMALTYSMLYLLEKIAKERNRYFNYIIFDSNAIPEKIPQICQELKIEESKINVVSSGVYGKFRAQIKCFKQNRVMKKNLSKCDFVIDLTFGDSFTDIYGQDRFNNYTKIKEVTEKENIPLILGPQTYGPFIKTRNRNLAKKVIENSFTVISRDQMSADYIREFSNKKIEEVTDVAFFLPYKKSENDSDKIKIGVNISGLLIHDKTEDTELSTNLLVDYDEYINRILNYLCADPRYEVYLIPHVGNDGNCEYQDRYNNVIVHNAFDSPIKAKNFISGMDLFIGSRMHATIAAFSSGVATIPVAYSRKFSGLFEALGYNHVIDLCKLSTDQATNATINLIQNLQMLRNETINALPRVEKEKNHLKNILNDIVDTF